MGSLFIFTAMSDTAPPRSRSRPIFRGKDGKIREFKPKGSWSKKKKERILKKEKQEVCLSTNSSIEETNKEEINQNTK